MKNVCAKVPGAKKKDRKQIAKKISVGRKMNLVALSLSLSFFVAVLVLSSYGRRKRERERERGRKVKESL